MDYRVFNVRTWLFLSVRINLRGLGTPTASQHNIFDSEKEALNSDIQKERKCLKTKQTRQSWEQLRGEQQGTTCMAEVILVPIQYLSFILIPDGKPYSGTGVLSVYCSHEFWMVVSHATHDYYR